MSDDDPGVEAWKQHTSAFDRVQAVAETLSTPRTATWVAEEAAVAENTARNHLERLVDLNVLVAEEDGAATTYAPDPIHARVTDLRDLLETHDRDQLIARRAELQERIDQWREDHDADTPADLRAQAATTTSAETTRHLRQTANDWDLVAYRLDLIAEAIERYDQYQSGRPSTA